MNATTSNVSAANVDAEDMSKTVQSIIICGSSADLNSITSVLHWRLYAVIGVNRAVKLDMAPEFNMRGRLKCRSVGYYSSQNAEGEWTVWPSRSSVPLTVQDLLSILIYFRYTDYKFTSGYEGCRHWCTEVIRLLEQQTYLSEGSVEAFENYIIRENQINPSRFPLPIIQGRFTSL